MSTTTSRRGGSSATTLAGDPFEQKLEKNISQDQTLARRKNPEKGLSKKARVLRWEQINTATWILFDPAGPQIIVPRSHGQWPGFKTPTALAWVCDVGTGRTDWRIRIRIHKGGWRALGCISDLDLAKRIAQAEVAP
jgi:hypothetical protein